MAELELGQHCGVADCRQLGKGGRGAARRRQGRGDGARPPAGRRWRGRGPGRGRGGGGGGVPPPGEGEGGSGRRSVAFWVVSQQIRFLAELASLMASQMF